MSSQSVFTWKMGSRIGIYAGNFNSKMANDVNIIAVVFFSALSALIHLNTCMKLLILQKVILRKRKVAMLSYPVAFSFRNEFRFVFTWDRSQISIWIEISIRNEIRIELDTDWIVTHSGLIQTFNMVCIKMEWVHSGLKVNPDSCKQHLTANIQGI